MSFLQKLASAISDNQSCLCVGLDPNLDLLPTDVQELDKSDVQKVERFLKTVIEVTQDHCAAYKPNLGFFEALGSQGWELFFRILDEIPSDKIIIADAKRGDISSTAEHYSKAFFEQTEVDAITLNPLMGFETLEPFLADKDKGIYTLALTSNPGAADLLLQKLSSGQTISSYIAQQLSYKQENSEGAIGMVVGATQAEDLRPVITEFSEAPLLIPGVGKQGGSITALADALDDHLGLPLINSSRSIIYAGNDTSHWEQAVSESAEQLTHQLRPITKKYV
ncbi:orotidine-5'-phosphate decarboxylase [Fodinibius salsisoli]|uniref:Orotidine-5'-phosphate decarboxylase n=1 Tax=Fodinibius salsisoli TaxID=2820877 RepID=A0ABT3PRT4_9BACT|nr:orotidine-5'-phosphate decarboxylase [Fodinibius salsisoli]MCW9708573.1 orotidine-5'-phosphate decarboxylase [Fodinibius salsisoli]